MEILCTPVRFLRRADRHLRQSGREGHQFGLGYSYPHHRHLAADVGHRALRAARGRDKGDTASCLALPRAERGGDGLSWLFYFKALQTGEVSRVAPIDKLSVVITICLSFLFLKEPVSLRVVAGALLITGGSIIMLIK